METIAQYIKSHELFPSNSAGQAPNPDDYGLHMPIEEQWEADDGTVLLIAGETFLCDMPSNSYYGSTDELANEQGEQNPNTLWPDSSWRRTYPRARHR